MNRSRKRAAQRQTQYAISGERIPTPRPTDWKGVAVLVTALVGAAGFLWNKLEGCAERTRSDAVQAASYQTLAEGIDALTKRVSTLEQAVVALPTLFSKKQADAEKLVAPVKQPAPLTKSPSGAVDWARASGAVVLTPPDELFQKMSGLPSFDEVQRAAEPKN